MDIQQPMSSMNPMNTPVKPHSKIGVPALVALFVLLLLITWIMWKGSNVQNENTATQKEIQYTQEKAISYSVDVNKAGSAQSKFPKAFITNTPVSADAVVTESFATEYPEKGLTQSALGYTTKQSAAEVYALYESYMTKEGYTFANDGKKQNEMLAGTKGKNQLLVSIGKRGDDTSVSVIYLMSL